MKPMLRSVQEAIHSHLLERGEPASYLHVHTAGLIALTEAHALKDKEQEFDDAMRGTQALIQNALTTDERFVHYSSGENVDTGVWGLYQREGDSLVATLPQNDIPKISF